MSDHMGGGHGLSWRTDCTPQVSRYRHPQGSTEALIRFVKSVLEHGYAHPGEDLSWQGRALCAEVDLDLPYPGKGANITATKKICARCEVRAECLEFGLKYDLGHGVWGGTSAEERKQIRRGRGMAEPEVGEVAA